MSQPALANADRVPAPRARPRLEAVGRRLHGWRGRARLERLLVETAAGTFAVCRGIGGSEAGVLADAAAEQLGRDLRVEALDVRPTVLDMRQAFHRADREVWLRTRVRHRRAQGVAAVALVVGAGTAAVGQVGDAHAFLWRPGVGLQRMTQGASIEAIAAASRRSDVPVEAMLGGAVAAPGARVTPHVPGDVFLLASDGLDLALGEEGLDALLEARARDPLTRCADAIEDAVAHSGWAREVSFVLVRV